MKILYLTFFESVLENGIYETQVKQVLCRLGATYGHRAAISHYAILPAVRIGRRGVSFALFDQRRELRELKRDYQQNGVKFGCIFLPIVTLRRWGAQMSLPLLALLTFVALPFVAFRVASHRPAILHCRSYMATAIALAVKWVFPSLKVVFDPRGFWPEEGVAEKVWPEGSITFRCWKKIEKYLTSRSDITIALSQTFADHLRAIDPRANCHVVYTSVDVERFRKARELRAQRREQFGFHDSKVFVYNGSLGSWHDPELLARMYRLFGEASGNAKLLVLTGYDSKKLSELFQKNGLDTSEFLVMMAPHDEVASYLAAADFGLVPLRDVTESQSIRVIAETMIGTKVSEYLASGLPIIVNRNVGGLRPLMAEYKVGILWDPDAPQDAVRQFKAAIENGSCRKDCDYVASRYFSLDEVTKGYFETYQQLVSEQCHA
jgi:glycosyltransferase involved in cell wall biosynthesis